MKKLLIAGPVLLIILLLAAVVAIGIFIDSIARSAIERGGSYALGVPTTLQSADVGILSGEFSMGGLAVDNPDGFPSEHFLSLGNGGVSVSLGTLREETVEMNTLELGALAVNIEKRDGKTNVQTIMDNLKRFESDEPTAEPDPTPQGEGKKFIIRTVDIRDVKIHVDVVPIGGDLTKVDIPIDRIQLENVGSENAGGVLLDELISIIVKAVIAAAAENGGGLIPTDLLNDLQSGLAQLEDLDALGINLAAGVGDQLESLTGDLSGQLEDVTSGLEEDLQDQVKDVEDKAKDAIDDVTKGIGNLLGGDDKDK